MAKTERLDAPYPMLRIAHRSVDADYCGPVFVWDLDKTYLDTRFSQLRHLVKIPLEFGVDKRAVPGTPALLHGLRDGPGGRAHRPLFFVSASPYQLHRTIARKMLLDGVEFDGITYKDPLRVLLRGHVGELKHQLGFKLSALLLLFRDLSAGSEIYLFGDDAEQDALVYCLFADVAAGRLRGRRLADTLTRLGVRAPYQGALVALCGTLPAREAVSGVYIHLVRCPDGSSVRDFGPRVVGFPSAAGAGRHLHGRGLLGAAALEKVGEGAGQPVAVFTGTADPDEGGWWTPRTVVAARGR